MAHHYQPQRALRSKKFNPDRTFQSWLDIFNLNRKLQSRSKFSIQRCFTGPSWCYREGLDRANFNPRSIARNFQSRRSQSKFFNPRAPWDQKAIIGELISDNRERRTNEELVYVLLSPIRNDLKHTPTNSCHPPSPGTISQFCLCLCLFSLPETSL